MIETRRPSLQSGEIERKARRPLARGSLAHLTLWTLLGCGRAEPPAEDLRPRITFGAAATAQHPDVVFIDTWRVNDGNNLRDSICTGVAIHPCVVVTAKHCNPEKVFPGEQTLFGVFLPQPGKAPRFHPGAHTFHHFYDEPAPPPPGAPPPPQVPAWRHFSDLAVIRLVKPLGLTSYAKVGTTEPNLTGIKVDVFGRIDDGQVVDEVIKSGNDVKWFMVMDHGKDYRLLNQNGWNNKFVGIPAAIEPIVWDQAAPAAEAWLDPFYGATQGDITEDGDSGGPVKLAGKNEVIGIVRGGYPVHAAKESDTTVNTLADGYLEPTVIQPITAKPYRDWLDVQIRAAENANAACRPNQGGETETGGTDDTSSGGMGTGGMGTSGMDTSGMGTGGMGTSSMGTSGMDTGETGGTGGEPVCGDFVCDESESCGYCPEDCGPCECGDATCDDDYDENCVTCPEDCGQCTHCDSCEADECDWSCLCGDGLCDPTVGEDCSNCPEDCNLCPVSIPPTAPCTPEEFTCATLGICIPIEYQCDGIEDCWLGSDESSCGGTGTTTDDGGTGGTDGGGSTGGSTDGGGSIGVGTDGGWSTGGGTDGGGSTTGPGLTTGGWITAGPGSTTGGGGSSTGPGSTTDELGSSDGGGSSTGIGSTTDEPGSSGVPIPVGSSGW